MANLGFSGDQSWTAGNPFLGAQNPYLQQNIDATVNDMTKAYQLGTAPQMATANVNSGSFGNSGLQQMQQEQQRQFANSLGQTIGGMRMQDYGNQQQMYQWDQGFNRNLYNDAFAQNQQNLQNYMGLLSTGNQLGQQDINNATNIYNTPMNYWSNFSNNANSVANGFGSSTTSQYLPSSPMMGALGGWQLGSALSKSYNNNPSVTNANGATDFMWPTS